MISKLKFLIIAFCVINYVYSKEHMFFEKDPISKMLDKSAHHVEINHHIKWITNQTTYPLKLTMPILENDINKSLDRDWLRLSDNMLVSKLPDLFQNYLISETGMKSQMLLLNYNNQTHEQLSSYEPKIVFKAENSQPVFLETKSRDIFTLAYLKSHKIKTEKSYERIRISCDADFLISNTNKEMIETIMVQMEKYTSFKIALKSSSHLRQQNNLYNSNLFLTEKHETPIFKQNPKYEQPDQALPPLDITNQQQQIYQPTFQQPFQQLQQPQPIFQQQSQQLQQPQPIFQQSSQELQQQPQPSFKQPYEQLQQQNPLFQQSSQNFQQQINMPHQPIFQGVLVPQRPIQQHSESIQQIPYDQIFKAQQHNYDYHPNTHSNIYESYKNDMNRYYNDFFNLYNQVDGGYLNKLRLSVSSANIGSVLSNYGYYQQNPYFGRFKRSKEQIEKESNTYNQQREEIDYDPKKFIKIRLSLGAVSIHRPFELEEVVSCDLNLINKDDGNLSFSSKIFKTISTDDLMDENDIDFRKTPIKTQESHNPESRKDQLMETTENIVNQETNKDDDKKKIIVEEKEKEIKHKESMMFFFDKIRSNETHDEADFAKMDKYINSSKRLMFSSFSLSVLISIIGLIQYF